MLDTDYILVEPCALLCVGETLVDIGLEEAGKDIAAYMYNTVTNEYIVTTPI